MKTLYSSKGFRYGEDADSLARETHAALVAIFQKYIEMGYSPREISHIISAEVTDLELDAVLNARPKLSPSRVSLE
jgi:hypothetical protein